MIRWIVLCGLAVLVLTAPLRADDCSAIELQRASTLVKDTRAQLLGDAVEEMDTNVPPPVQRHLANMKDALAVRSTVTWDARLRIPQTLDTSKKVWPHGSMRTNLRAPFLRPSMDKWSDECMGLACG